MGNHDPGNVFRIILVGAVFYLAGLGSLMVVVMIASVFRRLENLVNYVKAASARLQRNSALPIIWGFAASVLLVVLTEILFHHPPFRLLGLATLLLFLALAGLGLAVAGLAQGQSMLHAFNAPPDDLKAVRLGLSVLFFAEFIPIAGWLAVGLSAFAGAGAFLEALARIIHES